MMYIEQSLAPEEKLIHIGRFHWFYDVQALANLGWGLLFAVGILIFAAKAEPFLPGTLSVMSVPLAQGDGWLMQIRKIHPLLKLIALLIFLFGVMRFAQMMVTKSTTEMAVTSQRLILKRGVVARYVGEMNIDRIEGVSVAQSFWGRIFGFGRLMIRGMGVGELILPPIANPLAFRRAIEKARQYHDQKQRSEP